MRRGRGMLSVLLVAATALGAAGQEDGPLGRDSRFRGALSLAVKGLTLEALLADLRTREKLPVRADALTRFDRVTLFCRSRPAAEVLGGLADHLGFTWQRDTSGPGFVLTQTPAQQQGEQRARAQILETDYRLLREAAREFALQGRMAPEARREQQAKQLEMGLAGAPTPSHRAYLESQIAALRSGDYSTFPAPSEKEALAVALAEMSDSEWDRMWQNTPFRFSYPAVPGRHALTHARALELARLYLAGYHADGRRRGGRLYEMPCDVTRVLGEVFPRVRDQKVELYLRCRLLGLVEGKEELRVVKVSPLVSTRSASSDGPLGDEVDLREPSLQGPPPALPSVPQPGRTLAELLEALSPGLPLVLIADHYEPSLPRTLAPSNGPRLADWLAEQCRYHGVRARRTGTILSFRSKARSLLRGTQVPEPTYQRWTAAMKQGHAYSLDTLCEIAGSLSESQLDVFSRRIHQQPINREVVRFFDEANGESLDALRLLALLGPKVRASLPQPPAAPLVLRQPEVRPLLSGLLAEYLGESFDHSALRQAKLIRSREALFDDAVRAEQGGPVGIRLWRFGVDFHRHPEGFGGWGVARGRGSLDPFPGAGKREFNGTGWVLEILPAPGSQEMVFYTFFTGDPFPPAAAAPPRAPRS